MNDGVFCHDVSCEDRIRQRRRNENKFHIMAPFTGALFTPAGSSKVNSQEWGVWNPADFSPLTYAVRQTHCPRPGIFLHHSLHISHILLSTVATGVDPVQMTDRNLMRAVSQWQYYFNTKLKRGAVRSTSGGRDHKKNWGKQKHLFFKIKTWNSMEVATRGCKPLTFDDEKGLLDSSDHRFLEILRRWSESSFSRSEYAPTRPPRDCAQIAQQSRHTSGREADCSSRRLEKRMK